MKKEVTEVLTTLFLKLLSIHAEIVELRIDSSETVSLYHL